MKITFLLIHNICCSMSTSSSNTTSPQNKTTNLWTTVALLVLAILLIISYKLKDILQPEVVATAVLDTSCDLRKAPCHATFPAGGEVTFSIVPQEIPILQPLKLQVTTQNIKASAIKVDFVGIGMDMGYNRPDLVLQDDGGFMGSAILPVCVRARMEWEARVLIHTDKGQLMAPFRFYTEK